MPIYFDIFKKYDTIYIMKKRKGSMPEWLMGADCKSAGYAYAGSNPARLKKAFRKLYLKIYDIINIK